MIIMKPFTLLTGVVALSFCINTIATKVLSDPADTTTTVKSTFVPIGKCQLLLPKVIYAAPGQEANIYFDNVVLESFPGKYLFDVTCAKGDQQTERWTWTPTEKESGDYPLQIEVRDVDDTILATGSTSIHVAKADAGAAKQIKVLCIGDSLTAASIYTAEIAKLGSGGNNPQVTLLGTTGPGSGNVHEGYGGWRYETFLDKWVANPAPDATANLKSSPFLFMENGKPTFDFPRYLKEKLNGEMPDYVTIMLGTNDVFGATDENRSDTVESMIGYAKTLIDGIRAALPNAKIAILPPVPPNASQDAFGANYHSNQTRWGYRKNQFLAVLRLTQVFGDRENENLYIVPAYVNLDCAHNFPSALIAVNARNETKLMRGTNGVHPAAPGYLQIADSIFGWLKSQL
jgi:lysophospholipase L1-like esterase